MGCEDKKVSLTETTTEIVQINNKHLWDLQSLTSCLTSSQNMTETIRAAALLCCPVLVAECFYVSLWHLVLTKER